MSEVQKRHECNNCDCIGCDCDWYNGFDAGFDGNPPDSPGAVYLEGFCDGAIEREEFDEEQPWDDEEHPDGEYEAEKESA